MRWTCDGYGDNVGQCNHRVDDEGLYADPVDTAQGAPVVLCPQCAKVARADGTMLVPLGEWLEAK